MYLVQCLITYPTVLDTLLSYGTLYVLVYGIVHW